MRTIFFDLDGTLLNTQAGIALSIRHTLNLLDQPDISEQRLIDCFGPPLRVSFAQLLNTSDSTLIQQAVHLFRQHYLRAGIHLYQVYPGVLDMLKQLRGKDLKLCVLTAKPQAQAEWLLQDAGIDTFFEQTYGSEDRGVRSDKRTHLAQILKHSGAVTRNCWMVGDRALDMHAARANNIHAVAAHWGYATVQELQTGDYDHLIQTPAQLVVLMNNRSLYFS